ncbi:MAG: hypothetical protein RBT80_28545 [Candidatus Vecturithrix sp.]|nr:hypothetical protein [Candidatus Vecturithrix sp.]
MRLHLTDLRIILDALETKHQVKAANGNGVKVILMMMENILWRKL